MDCDNNTQQWPNSDALPEPNDSKDDTLLESLPLYIIARSLWLYGSPVILVLGTFGNLMTLIITSRMKSHDSSIGIYFVAIAVADLMTLYWALMPKWVNMMFGVRLHDRSRAFCKIWIVLNTCTSTISCWLLVSWTIHRAASILWPHRVTVLFPRRRVIGIVLAVSGFFFLGYSHFIYGFDSAPINNGTSLSCRMHSPSYIKFFEEIYTYVELVIYSALPFFCLSVANCVLVGTLTVSVRNARKNLTSGNNDQMKARDKVKNSVTLTTIVVSLAFIVLTLPSCVYYIMFYMDREYNKVDNHEYARIYLFYAVSYLMMYINSAINFYLYCLTGTRFRQEFLSFIRPWQRPSVQRVVSANEKSVKQSTAPKSCQ